MAYNGPWILKVKKEKEAYYISRGTKRFKLTDDQAKAMDALIDVHFTNPNDNLVEHWADGKWQKKTP